MAKPRISIIAAVARSDRAIGRDNALLWDIPEDMRYFRSLTTGHTIIMGKNTYRSIGHALPKRTNIVLSTDETLSLDGCIIVHSVAEALQRAGEKEPEEIFIIGGAGIYKQFLPFAERLYLTLVEGKYEADTFFPDYREFSKLLSEETVDNGHHIFTFVVLEKA